MDIQTLFQDVTTQGLGVVIAIIATLFAIWLVRNLLNRIDRKDNLLQRQNDNMSILNVNTVSAINSLKAGISTNNRLTQTLINTLEKPHDK